MATWYFEGGDLTKPYDYIDPHGTIATTLPSTGDLVIGSGSMFGDLSVGTFQVGDLTSGMLTVDVADRVAASGGQVSAQTAPNGAWASNGGSFKAAGTISSSTTAESGGVISAAAIINTEFGLGILSSGAGSSISAADISGPVDAYNAGSVDVSTLTGYADAQGGIVTATTILGSGSATADGTVTATTITQGPSDFIGVSASNGGTIIAVNVVNAETSNASLNTYVVSIGLGGTGQVQNLYSTGATGMDNSVDGGTLNVANYDVASKVGLGDVLDIMNGGTVNITGSINIGERVGDSTNISADASSFLYLPGSMFKIGDAGYGDVSFGAVRSIPGADLGVQSTGLGQIFEDAPTESLTIQNSLIDGDAGQGNLVVGYTANVEIQGSMVVGNQPSGVGDLFATNGATLTVDGLLILGNAGKSTGYNNVYLAGTIDAKGGIVAGAMATGNSTRDNPSLEVTDPGSGLFTGGANVTLGEAGHGSLLIEGGAKFDAGTGTVTLGDAAGSGGGLTITGFNPNNPSVVTPAHMSVGALVVGNQGAASFSVDDSAIATIAGSLTLSGPSSYVTVGGGTLQAQDGLSIGDQPTDNAQLWVQGGTAAGTSYTGLLDWQQTLSIGDLGTGSLNVIDGGEVISEPNSVLRIGGTTGSSGFVDVSGAGSTLDIVAASIGGAMPTATNDQGQPDGTDGDWTYNGGVGSLYVADKASVSAGQTLALLAIAQIGTDGTETFQGGIDISSGAELEVGGTSGVKANTLQIDNGATLVGHGLIDSDVVGTVGSTGLPQYALTLDNLGTIEAKDGLLDLHGNVTADGTALIDTNSALEIGGTFASDGTVDFQDMNGGTLILDDIGDFYGTLAGLSDGTSAGIAVAASPGGIAIASTHSTEPQGSALLIRDANVTNNYAVVYATLGTFDGGIGLRIALGSDFDNLTESLGTRPVSGETMKSIHNKFFNVTQSGTDTILNYTTGNPIDLAINGPSARASYNGTGITIGVISNGFDASAIANDVSCGALPSWFTPANILSNGKGDEGRAMAQIVHDIAPGATIDFYSAGGSQANMANAITKLQAAGCNVIVDDVGFVSPWLPLLSHEPDIGGSINNAISTAAVAKVTYVTAAGNDRTQNFGHLFDLPIVGHALNPDAISVAAMNWLAVPAGKSTVGGYLPTQAEPFSSAAPSSAPDKPDITAPDGGPTTLQLGAPSGSSAAGLDPFFGTSAAAPVVAGVVALMLQASKYQLKPTAIDAILRQTATPDGVAANIGGTGLVNAQAAVAAAAARVKSLVKKPPSGGAGTSAFSIATASAGPTVTEADLSQPAGDLNSGSTLQVFVTLSNGVTVSGTPALILNDGGTAAYDPNTSDPANASLVFDYTPGSETTPNLVITGVAANGAIVQDASANLADFSSLFNVASGLSINSPLQVSSVAASLEGEVATGQTVEITLALNNGVTVNAAGGVATLALNNGATASYDGALSNPSSGTLVFDYVVGTSDATPDLSLFDVTLPDGTTVQDASGDNADFSGALNHSLGVQVDPSFVNLFGASQTGAISTGQTLQLSLTMTTPIVIDTSGGAPTLALNDGKAASYDAGASDPSTGTLVFDATVQSGDQVPDVQVTQVNLNGATVNDTHDVAVDFSGAVDYPTGLTVNSPIAVTAASASQSGTIGVGQTVTLGLALNGPASVGGIDNPFGPPTLTLNDDEAATYDAAASTATSLAFDYVVQAGDYSPDLTIVSVNANGNPIQDALGNNVDFTVATGAATGLAVVACFVAGTRIATDSGEIAVEALHIGDQVRTLLFRGLAPIVWIGCRRVRCARHPCPEQVWPVRVRAHAFGRGRPRRDLFLSPDHALYQDGVLIPVKHLINGTSVLQEPLEKVTYYHLELPRHNVVLAEGLAAESYLDTGDRANFTNGGRSVMLHPDLSSRVWEAEGCAPLVVAGPKLDAVRQRLNALPMIEVALAPPHGVQEAHAA